MLESLMYSYSLALYGHLLLVACLVGADIGRLYLARAGAAIATAESARILAVRSVLWISVVTDIALIMVFPAGFELGSILGAYRVPEAGWWRLAPWILPALLLLTTLVADRAATRGGGRNAMIADGIVRGIVGAGQVWDGASVIFLSMTHMVEADWLAAKLSIYGVVLLLSIPLRRSMLQLRRQLATPEARIPDTVLPAFVAELRRVQLPIVISWLLILILAWLGTAKPG
jgi:hypothetical protein